MGPVEVVIVSFPRAGLITSIGPLLVQLVESGHARVVDAILVSMHDNDSLVITDLDDTVVPAWSRICPQPRPLLNAADAELAAAGLDAGAVSIVLAVEQTWPAELSRLTDDVGGLLELHVRIPPDAARTASRVSA